MPAAFHPLGEILKTVIHRHGLTARLFEYQLQQRWPEIAGAQIAARSRPEQIRFRKLYLVVESSVWLQQLRFLVPTLIQNITKAAGEVLVTDIVLRVGEIRPPVVADAGPPDSTPPRPHPAASCPETGQLPMQDPELRARFATILASLASDQPAAAEAPAP